MKRALVFSPYLNILGGGEVYSLHVAQCLQKHHYQVVFAWPDASITSQLKTQLNISLTPVKFDGQAYQLLSSKGRLLSKWQHFKLYDLIFFVSDGSIPWLFGRQNILHFQVPFTHLNPTLINKFKLKTINHILCNSYFTKRVIDTKLHQNSTVIYPPVNQTPTTDTIKHNYILSVGRFTQTLHNKRQDILIQAFKKMVDQGLHDWILQLVGSTSEDNAMVQKLTHLAAGYPIEFHFNVSGSALQRFYAQAKIFWHAAGFDVNEHEQPEKVEHFGISTAEAMASGTIPIVINKGGQPEIITEGKNGFLFTTETELIKKTISLIENYFTCAPELIKKGQADAQKFSANNFCQQFSTLCAV